MKTVLIRSMLIALSALSSLAFAQEDPKVSSERARANFGLPIVLAPDDVRAFEDAPAGFNKSRGEVPGGAVDTFEYDSAVTGTRRRANVYLPPGYSPRTKYPVLHLLHGIGGDEAEWLKVDAPNAILDNLIAEGRAVPNDCRDAERTCAADGRAIGDPFTREKVEGFAEGPTQFGA